MSNHVKKKWEGLHANRYSREPMEKKFALAWQRFCESPGGSTGVTNLDYLLGEGDQRYVSPCDERDRIVANTVIQWLGSTVGYSWLKEIMREE